MRGKEIDRIKACHAVCYINITRTGVTLRDNKLLVRDRQNDAMTMLAKVIVTVLVTAISGHSIWTHPMHSVHDEYPEEGQSTPAGSHHGRFLSLSRDQLIRIKRMLRRLPYRNALLDAIRNAATEAERGRDVDVSFDDIVPDPEDRLLEMWQFDNDFRTMAVEYMSSEHAQSKIQLLSSTNDVPDPEERNQT